MQVLLRPAHDRARWCAAASTRRSSSTRCCPTTPGRFPWAGHLGAQMQQPVVEEIERSATTLVFTNMRSQAEIWYQLLLEARPDWAGLIALHHGSLDKASARVGRARPEGRAR